MAILFGFGDILIASWRAQLTLCGNTEHAGSGDVMVNLTRGDGSGDAGDGNSRERRTSEPPNVTAVPLRGDLGESGEGSVVTTPPSSVGGCPPVVCRGGEDAVVNVPSEVVGVTTPSVIVTTPIAGTVGSIESPGVVGGGARPTREECVALYSEHLAYGAGSGGVAYVRPTPVLEGSGARSGTWCPEVEDLRAQLRRLQVSHFLIYDVYRRVWTNLFLW